MTYGNVIDEMVKAAQVVGQTHPELLAEPLDPGAEVVFDVDTEMGAVQVKITVPQPLLPPRGSARVSFRPGTPVEVILPRTAQQQQEE